MKKFWKWSSRLLAAALAIYVAWLATDQLSWSGVHHVFEQPLAIAGIIAAALAYCVIYPSTGIAWQQLLKAQNVQQPKILLSVIIGKTQLAKYIPGNIAQHATRAALGIRAGIPWPSYIATAWQEALLSVTASMFVGLSLLALPSESFSNIPDGVWAITACATLGALFLCTRGFPAGKRYSHPRLTKWASALGRPPGLKITLLAFFAYATNYLVVGVAIWIIAGTLDLTPGVPYALLTSAFALSWALGFLAPGAPAGIGAREGVMLLVLRGSAPPDELLLLVLLTRIATIVGDLIAFIAAHSISRILPVRAE